jgi:hypothetical protein
MTEPYSSGGPRDGGQSSPTPPEQFSPVYRPGYNMPGYNVPPPPPPPKERQVAGMVILSIMGGLVVFGLIAAALSSRAKTGGAAGGPANTGNSPVASSAPAVPVHHVLIVVNGSGIRESAPFNVGHGPLTVRYRFNCASSGGAGNFIADALYGDQSSLNSDDQSIANALAKRGHQITTIYPSYPGKKYHLEVNSECSWHITVTGR